MIDKDNGKRRATREDAKQEWIKIIIVTAENYGIKDLRMDDAASEIAEIILNTVAAAVEQERGKKAT